MHNARPALLSNDDAQCKTIVRSTWHNGFARVSEAISAWHNGFGVVQIFFDRFLFNTIQYYNHYLELITPPVIKVPFFVITRSQGLRFGRNLVEIHPSSPPDLFRQLGHQNKRENQEKTRVPLGYP